MIILLPTKIDGLKLLESSITYGHITSLNSRLRTKRFDAVMIPKFKTEASLDLVGVLQKLGATDLFNERLANLTGISGSNQDHLFVSNAFHRSFIDVNEKGTEAAAASGKSNYHFTFKNDMTKFLKLNLELLKHS